MELDQIYYNAANMFQNDPELRNLLMRTLDNANTDGLPGIRNPATMGAPGMGSPEMMNASNAAAKSNPLVPSGMAAPQPQDAVPGQAAPPQAAPQMPAPQMPAPPMPMQRPPGAPQPGPAIPGIIPTAASGPAPGAPAPRLPAPTGPSTGQSISAFLQGLGSSDAILPAIGGGMAAVENLEKQGQVRNQTVRALMSRGLDAESASAAASNPEILKAVLPTLFGNKDVDRAVGSDFDPTTGKERKFFYNQKGKDPGVQYIGGAKSDAASAAVSTAMAKNNIKQVQVYKSEADAARELQGQLSLLEENRKAVPDKIKGLPPGVAKTVTGWTDYFGYTNGAQALNPQELGIQLGFTAKTKGAITDREMGMFAAAVPGLGMTDEAANKVIVGMRAAAQRKIEQSKFYESWLAKNKGSLEGAQSSWDAYTNANPVINLNTDGSLSINNKNINNWQNYVNSDDEDRVGDYGPASGDVGIRQPGPDDELPGAGGANGGFSSSLRPGTNAVKSAPTRESAAPGGGPVIPPAKTGRPTISSKAERDILPPGTTYYYQGTEMPPGEYTKGR